MAPVAHEVVASWPAGHFAENIAVDPSGIVYVSLHSHHRIDRYDPRTRKLERDLMQIAAHQPGQVAGHVLRGPTRAQEQEYFVVYRFADEARLRAWEESSERKAFVARIDPLTVSGNRSELTGLEAWFDLPTGLPPLSIHRLALLT
jgi:antibiotic biosynthesis monooxygenase (ABM) superfamily enzyme